ncbi:DUF1656 domain-containing protein [Sphingomonas sp. BIUV-7]|uniref:DUF1656 domain-containing protein n=1 Tax=Sphingomonas natans TaxID=3063330 RepID=A0ABT8Y946_9SPHN|nr:DUF1656 domain-containing protein [Sphingomonas sp. BIUV-7]MDO6414195.1 DUF1656 domain-containing protein [Sphingomonas sp. BIUV-7]
MIGEISIFGVFFPKLLLVGLVALGACGVATTVLSRIGFYRLVAQRPVVDLAFFVFIFAALIEAGRTIGL